MLSLGVKCCQDIKFLQFSNHRDHEQIVFFLFTGILYVCLFVCAFVLYCNHLGISPGKFSESVIKIGHDLAEILLI